MRIVGRRSEHQRLSFRAAEGVDDIPELANRRHPVRWHIFKTAVADFKMADDRQIGHLMRTDVPVAPLRMVQHEHRRMRPSVDRLLVGFDVAVDHLLHRARRRQRDVLFQIQDVEMHVETAFRQLRAARELLSADHEKLARLFEHGLHFIVCPQTHHRAVGNVATFHAFRIFALIRLETLPCHHRRPMAFVAAHRKPEVLVNREDIVVRKAHEIIAQSFVGPDHLFGEAPSVRPIRMRMQRPAFPIALQFHDFSC